MAIKENHKFELVSKFKPAGSQPQAIKSLVEGVKKGKSPQTLLGVTGSGKTFSIASVIAQVQKKTLVLAHNKTLAAQLYNEFKSFFPNNRVEYFVSFYDYYQPESYIPSTDQYIEKDSQINEYIERTGFISFHNAILVLAKPNKPDFISSYFCVNCVENTFKAIWCN